VTDHPPLRRSDKQMSEADALALLASAYACRVGTVSAHGWPYVVPLLYVYLDGELWVHNPRARGHLRENVERDPRVCFEVDEPGPTFPYGPIECDTNVAYRSVIVYGRARIVDDRAAKQRFFSAFMDKYRDPAWDRPRDTFPRLDGVTVYAISIERMTGKETPLPAPEAQWPASG
jgi:nitroimidazol reductase NimA-like FMN-containing flavoprotein (pyridoxamine 5'-phosphate oxidase superfamily)